MLGMASIKQHMRNPHESFVPLIAALLVCLAALLIVTLRSEVHEPSTSNLVRKLLWKNASTRPPFLIFLTVAGWAWVVRVCRGSALNLEFVLGGAVQRPSATLQAALLLLVLLLVGHLVHIIASETPGLQWRPWLVCNIALHALFALLGVMPLQRLCPEARFSLMRTLAESVVAPFAPVTFWHVIVADYLTSMAKAMSDLQLTSCIASRIFTGGAAGGVYVRSTELWNAYHESCADTYGNAVMLALPFWWRLMQCLKVYSQTREQKNLWNALKYSTAFPLVYAGYLRRHAPSRQHDHFFIAAAIVQSCFTFVWDVLMDWGLPQRASSSAASPAPCCGYVMREPLLVTRRKSVYLLLCVNNLLLRFAWTLSVFGGLPGRGAGMFFFETIEVFRRTVWAVFRIEWEVVVKVYNSSPETKQLTASDGETGDEMQPLDAFRKDIDD